jgi:hypothetical protein
MAVIECLGAADKAEQAQQSRIEPENIGLSAHSSGVRVFQGLLPARLLGAGNGYGYGSDADG